MFGWFGDVEKLWIAVKSVFQHISPCASSDCLIGLNVSVIPLFSFFLFPSDCHPTFLLFWNKFLTPQPLVRMVGQYIGIYGIPYNMCYVDCLRTVYCRHILNFTKKQIVVEIISRYIDFLSLSSELKLFYSWSRNRKLFHRWSLNWKLFYRWSLNWKRVLRWSLNWNFFIVGLWIKTFSSLISELKLFHRWSLNWNFFIVGLWIK